MANTVLLNTLLTTEVIDYSFDRFMMAVTVGSTKMINRLLSRNVSWFNSVMNLASEKGRIQTVKFMMDLGADGFDESLSCAVKSGHLAIVQILAPHAINIESPLVYAAKMGDIQMVEILIKNIYSLKNSHTNTMYNKARHTTQCPKIIRLLEVEYKNRTGECL